MPDTTQNPQPIIDLILADVNAVIPNISSLVASYRLLVGASEEIRRTPEVCPDVFERAVRRADNAGTIIDVFLELLCCKIAFSSEFLKISCAPVDLFRLLANRTTATDIPFHTAEQVVEIEVLRRILEKCQCQDSCLPNHTVVCPKAPGSGPPTHIPTKSSDIQDVEAAIILSKLQSQAATSRDLSPDPTLVYPETACPPLPISEKAADDDGSAVTITNQHATSEPANQLPIQSRVRRKHLKDAYDTLLKSKKR